MVRRSAICLTTIPKARVRLLQVVAMVTGSEAGTAATAVAPVAVLRLRLEGSI